VWGYFRQMPSLTGLDVEEELRPHAEQAVTKPGLGKLFAVEIRTVLRFWERRSCFLGIA
jgi:hypothetical protein